MRPSPRAVGQNVMLGSLVAYDLFGGGLCVMRVRYACVVRVCLMRVYMCACCAGVWPEIEPDNAPPPNPHLSSCFWMCSATVASVPMPWRSIAEMRSRSVRRGGGAVAPWGGGGGLGYEADGSLQGLEAWRG
jgi:hypothetical protein